MLSRVANSLFWLARYVERAENAARFLVVTNNYALELQGVSHPLSGACWDAARDLMAVDTDPGEDGTNLQRLLFDLDLDNSVYSNISHARENARSIRDAITSEMWEALNVMYLHLADEADRAPSATRAQTLLQDVQETGCRIQGLRDNALVRSDEWHFLRLGGFLERADNTLRAVDTMFRHPALQIASDAGQTIDTLHLSATLRVCTAFEAFSRTAPMLAADRVVEFMLLDGRFPRSVEFSLQQLQRSLHALSRTPEDIFTNEAEQLCGRLVAELRFARVEEILQQGLHETVARVLQSMGQISRAIGREYFT